MDAVKFIKDKIRMCKCYYITCTGCPLNNRICALDDEDMTVKEIEEIVLLVNKWSDEHPQKTMLQDLLEKYPNCELRSDGTPNHMCPHYLGYCKDSSFCNGNSCEDCWNRPMEE